jgi:hypothetical protein
MATIEIGNTVPPVALEGPSIDPMGAMIELCNTTKSAGVATPAQPPVTISFIPGFLSRRSPR